MHSEEASDNMSASSAMTLIPSRQDACITELEQSSWFRRTPTESLLNRDIMSSPSQSVSSRSVSNPDDRTEGGLLLLPEKAEPIDRMDRTESLLLLWSRFALRLWLRVELQLLLPQLWRDPMLLLLSCRSKPIRRNWLVREDAVVELDVPLPRELWSATKKRRVLFCRRVRNPCRLRDDPGLSITVRRLSGGSSRKLRVDPPRSRMGSVRTMTLRALRLRFRLLVALKLFILSLLLGVLGV